jgi:hypothetical protein
LSKRVVTREDMMEKGTLASDMSERGRTYAAERRLQTELPDTLSLKIRLTNSLSSRE